MESNHDQQSNPVVKKRKKSYVFDDEEIIIIKKDYQPVQQEVLQGVGQTLQPQREECDMSQLYQHSVIADDQSVFSVDVSMFEESKHEQSQQQILLNQSIQEERKEKPQAKMFESKECQNSIHLLNLVFDEKWSTHSETISGHIVKQLKHSYPDKDIKISVVTRWLKDSRFKVNSICDQSGVSKKYTMDTRPSHSASSIQPIDGYFFKLILEEGIALEDIIEKQIPFQEDVSLLTSLFEQIGVEAIKQRLFVIVETAESQLQKLQELKRCLKQHLQMFMPVHSDLDIEIIHAPKRIYGKGFEMQVRQCIDRFNQLGSDKALCELK